MLQYIRRITALLIFLVNVSINAELICTFNDRFQKNIICNVDSKDNVILTRGVVSDRNRTGSINLQKCRLQDINSESLKGLFYLQTLDLSQNNLRNLNKDIFNELITMKNLNLSNNKVTDLNTQLFVKNINLEILDLKNNQINIIINGLFDKAKKLKQLDLSKNNIVGNELNENIFKETNKLELLSFSGNDLSGTPENILQDLQFLDKLYLDGCFLKEMPLFITKNNMQQLKHLSLSKNEVDNLEDATLFKNLISLEELNLNENLIADIHENVFKPMSKLRILQLRANMIKVLPETIFQNMKKLGNIDLSHNKIENIPVNAFRGTSLKNLNLSDNKFSYLASNFCLELSNSGAKLTKFYFNENPWQCACLQELIAEVKKKDIEYNSAHFDGKEVVCTSDIDFRNCKRHASDNTHFIMLYEENKRN